MQKPYLRAESTETSIRIYRGNDAVPILEQHAPKKYKRLRSVIHYEKCHYRSSSF
jgi:hypothetical protein